MFIKSDNSDVEKVQSKFEVLLTDIHDEIKNFETTKTVDFNNFEKLRDYYLTITSTIHNLQNIAGSLNPILAECYATYQKNKKNDYEETKDTKETKETKENKETKETKETKDENNEEIKKESEVKKNDKKKKSSVKQNSDSEEKETKRDISDDEKMPKKTTAKRGKK
jgi:type I site-specific restriction-modification system R (restriction) subunit